MNGLIYAVRFFRSNRHSFSLVLNLYSPGSQTSLANSTNSMTINRENFNTPRSSFSSKIPRSWSQCGIDRGNWSEESATSTRGRWVPRHPRAPTRPRTYRIFQRGRKREKAPFVRPTRLCNPSDTPTGNARSFARGGRVPFWLCRHV